MLKGKNKQSNNKTSRHFSVGMNGIGALRSNAPAAITQVIEAHTQHGVMPSTEKALC